MTSIAASIGVVYGSVVTSLRTAPAALHSPVSARLTNACKTSKSATGPVDRASARIALIERPACAAATPAKSASGAASGLVATSSADHTPSRDIARGRSSALAASTRRIATQARPSTAAKSATSIPENKVQSRSGTDKSSGATRGPIHHGARGRSARTERARSASDAIAIAAAPYASAPPRRPTSQNGARTSGYVRLVPPDE